MIQAPTEEYIGRTVQEMVEQEINRPEYGGLFRQSYFVTINGEVIPKESFEDIVIIQGDEITLVPLYAGG